MVSPNFKLKDLGKSDLGNVEINDVSDRLNLGYGRRFSLKIGDDESKGLVFKKVLKKVKKLAHHIEGPEELAKLEKLQGFVTKLKIANTAADVTYSKRSHWYKFRTWFHRLLDSGSHSDRLDKLEKSIQERIDEYHENESLLIKAIKTGDSRVINELMAADIDLNFRDADGNSPLIQAINDGWSELVECLIANGADVNFADSNGQTPLYFASEKGQIDTVKKLFAKGANPNIEDAQGFTPLRHLILLAVANGNSLNLPAIVKLFINNHADLNKQDANGDTLLHLSALSFSFIPNSGCSPDIIQMLIDENVSINTQNKDGKTALHIAARCGNVKALNVLIKNKADIHIQDNNNQTAYQSTYCLEAREILSRKIDEEKKAEHQRNIDKLCKAVKSSDIDAIKGMIEAGINLDGRDHEGGTPLIYATIEGKEEIANLLIAGGADVNLPDLMGTPLMAAIFKDQFSFTELLIANHADVNVQVKDGRTALHLAIAKGDIKSAELLINNGAALNLQNNEGISALHLAILTGSTKSAELLINNGAALNLQNNEGYTALHLAIMNGDESLVNLLIASGAEVNMPKNAHTPLQMAKSLENKNVIKILKSAMSADDIILQKEALKLSVLAHSVSLGGVTQTQIKETKAICKAPLTGSFANYMLKYMTKATKEMLLKVCMNQGKVNSEQIAQFKQELERLISLLESGRIQSSDVCLKRIAKGLPTLMMSGFKGHRVAVMCWGPYFIICNRGKAMRKVVEVYRYDQTKLDAEMINKITSNDSRDENAYKKLFFNELPTALGFQAQSATERNIENLCTKSLYVQKSGNCGWAAPEGCVFSYLVLMKLLGNDQGQLRQGAISNISKNQTDRINKDFFAWLSFAQAYNVDRYLGIHNTRSAENVDKVEKHANERDISVVDQGFINAVMPLFQSTLKKAM